MNQIEVFEIGSHVVIDGEIPAVVTGINIRGLEHRLQMVRAIRDPAKRGEDQIAVVCSGGVKRRSKMQRLKTFIKNIPNLPTMLAFRLVKRAIRKDPSYAEGWHSNIAMAIYDESRRHEPHVESVIRRRVCEEDTESCEECVAAASTYFEPLDDIPEIGSLQCLNNCRCY